MRAVADFHSHILPDLDDGSASLEESIGMLRMEWRQGISHVVATPHFYPRQDDPVQFLAKRKAAEEQLREEMARHPHMPDLSVGAEVHYFPGISESEILSELTIDGKDFILIEMPLVSWTDTMYRELENIRVKQGITPIIAHVDRYMTPLRTFRIPERLEELPVLVQANASFFLNKLSRGTALRLLRADRIHLLGSDCHNLQTRAPNLGPAIQLIEKHLGTAALDRIQSYQDWIWDNGGTDANRIENGR